jgi:hypothetical protein
MFNCKIISSKDSIKKKIFIFKNLNGNNDKNELNEKDIEKYLNSIYYISDNISNKIKSSELTNNILLYFRLDLKNIGLKNKISMMLIEIGLKKKRFSDGNYYYGLKLREKDHNIIEFDINHLIKQRKEQINNIKYNPIRNFYNK